MGLDEENISSTTAQLYLGFSSAWPLASAIGMYQAIGALKVGVDAAEAI